MLLANSHSTAASANSISKPRRFSGQKKDVIVAYYLIAAIASGVNIKRIWLKRGCNYEVVYYHDFRLRFI
jgi:hypothetical protein